MGFGPEKTTYRYFIATTPISHPSDSKARKIVAKCAINLSYSCRLIFFYEHGSLYELLHLNEAVQRWEGEGLSGHSRVIFDDLVCDVAWKIFIQQGYDRKALLQDIREMKDGKLNVVPLYLKEKANIEDSIADIKNKLERHKMHLLEIVMADGYGEVPKEWKLLHLCALKGFQMLFNNFNAFDSPTAILQNINMAIYEPLVMDVQRTLLPQFVLNARKLIKENTGESADKSTEKELLVMTKGQLQGVN